MPVVEVAREFGTTEGAVYAVRFRVRKLVAKELSRLKKIDLDEAAAN